MEIQNQNDSEDIVTVVKSENHKGHVWLGIGGQGKRSRHAHLNPVEARAVAYALLSYAEQVSVVSAGEPKVGTSTVEVFSKL